MSRVVDVFGMTADAITDVEDIQNFTYDGRHWSMAVNIVKAKVLLAQIARADAGEFAGRIPSRPLSSCQSRSARPTCLRVLSPVPGEVLDHRQQTVYALPFVLQIRCRQHSSPPRSLQREIGCLLETKGAAAERAGPISILPHQIPVNLGGSMPCSGL